MSFEHIIFYLFSGAMVLASLGVITSRNPVYSALYLVLTFFMTSAIWLLLEAEFLAIVLVLVYVGAVMVLFLFVVMMLNINMAELREGFVQYLPIGAVAALGLLGMMVYVLGPASFGLDFWAAPERHAADYNNTLALGQVLYTDYVLAFELAAVILLVAIVAAIALTFRRRPAGTTKHQKPSEQVQVRRNDRVRIVKMQSEKK